MSKGIRNVYFGTHKAACEFQAERRRCNDVVSWHIYKTQNGFTATPNCTMSHGAPLRLKAPTLDDIRKKIPPGLTYYPCDGQTEEVWI
jgi:hypothetical protein